MCGIIAYKDIGKRNVAASAVMKGLKVLEYRGYDSFGIASLTDNINISKHVGKIGNFSFKDLNLKESFVSIGHTRWATHGNVTEINTHPHFSSDKSFALVQNGIVENFSELKKDLMKKGFEFSSQTDTEVIVRLIEDELKEDDNITNAVKKAFLKLKGRNAIVLLTNTGDIVAVRDGSPLILGIKDDAFILASDPSPIIEHTKDVIFLDDKEMVVISNSYEISNISDNISIEKEIETITWDTEQAKKGDYEHFMIKEIMEQKHTIKDALIQDKDNILKISKMINDAFGTYAVGCGTAGKVCLYATYRFSDIAKKHINFAVGSEFSNYHHFIKKNSLLFTVSQSGETADTLEAIDVAKEKDAKVISIVNVMGSTIMRVSDKTLLINCGPEKAVCSTKATTAQMALFTLLGYAADNRYDEGLELLKKTADAADNMLNIDFCNNIHELAKKIKNNESMYVIGRGDNYPVALESAIKIQEVSYIHAEGFAGGELKHGPIALITKGTPCIVLFSDDENKEDILSNAIEIKSRGGYIVGIGHEENDIFDYFIRIPIVKEGSGILNLIPVQLLSYYLALEKGYDPDFPRNLAKSVTVK